MCDPGFPPCPPLSPGESWLSQGVTVQSRTAQWASVSRETLRVRRHKSGRAAASSCPRHLEFTRGHTVPGPPCLGSWSGHTEDRWMCPARDRRSQHLLRLHHGSHRTQLVGIIANLCPMALLSRLAIPPRSILLGSDLRLLAERLSYEVGSLARQASSTCPLAGLEPRSTPRWRSQLLRNAGATPGEELTLSLDRESPYRTMRSHPHSCGLSHAHDLA